MILQLFFGADDGNRTRVASLGSWGPAIRRHPHIKIYRVTFSVTISEKSFSKTLKPLKTKCFLANTSFDWEADVLPMYESCIFTFLLF